MYTQLLDVIQQNNYVQPDLIDITKLALALRSTAPKVEAYYHYYSNVVVPRMNSSVKSSFDDHCESWVEFDGQQYCSSQKLQKAITFHKRKEHADEIQTLPFDHVLKSSDEGAGTAVLYGDVMTTAFADLHNVLYKAALDDQITYVVRYKPGQNVNETVVLSGYGIELALKRTDYLVIDDRNNDNKEEKSGIKQKLVNFGKQMEANLFGSEKSTIEPLVPSQIKG